MQSGKLDQRIAIQSLTETNVSGELVISYTALATVWGEVISQKGGEAFEAARVNARETVRVRIRYRDDVLTTSRIEWMGQSYNILSIDRSARRDGYLWFTAEVNGAL